MKKVNTVTMLIILLSFISIKAQDVPFNCKYDAYLFQYNDVYSIDLASGNSYMVASNITEGNINAIGDINLDGIYFLKSSGTFYDKVDLNPASPTYTQHLGKFSLSKNINIHDWAFNAVDGNLYTVEKNTNILYRINPMNGEVISLGEVPVLSGLNYTYGAVYFDLSGRFYISSNQTGTIYVIQHVQNLDGKNTINSNLFAFGPSSASNDGARCPTAPVLQEICDNGIDDDGDGLIDCDDASCSNVGDCDIITAPTSGGNEGGLESNNRLSNKINKRNYYRAKTNYKFNRKNAKKVLKTATYAKKNNGSLQLQDFIPLGIINEEEIINSTPTEVFMNTQNIFVIGY